MQKGGVFERKFKTGLSLEGGLLSAPGLRALSGMMTLLSLSIGMVHGEGWWRELKLSSLPALLQEGWVEF